MCHWSVDSEAPSWSRYSSSARLFLLSTRQPCVVPRLACCCCCCNHRQAFFWLSPLSVYICATSLWVTGDIRSVNVPQCRPRNVRPCCYLSPTQPPDCYRSLARRGHRNCRVHTEVGLKFRMKQTVVLIFFYIYIHPSIPYYANVHILIRRQRISCEHLDMTTALCLEHVYCLSFFRPSS